MRLIYTRARSDKLGHSRKEWQRGPVLKNVRRLLLWSMGLWVLFVGVLIALILSRYYFLGPWLGDTFADWLNVATLLLIVFFGSRFIVKKLELASDLKLLLAIVTLWVGLSVILDLTIHYFLSPEDWNTMFVSSVLVQTDFWIVLILCEIVGPFLVFWLFWALKKGQA